MRHEKSTFSLLSAGIFLSLSMIGADMTTQKNTDSFTPNRVVKFNGKPITDGSIEIMLTEQGAV